MIMKVALGALLAANIIGSPVQDFEALIPNYFQLPADLYVIADCDEEKVDIQPEKVDIENQKVDIESNKTNDKTKEKPSTKKKVKKTYKKISLPSNENNDFKTYMDYRAITDRSSKQWQLQQEAYTDNYGMRKIGSYYCVALGSAFSSKIGTKFVITLEDGQSFKAILADQKSDLHTDSTNKYMPLSNGNINIVEFIVDSPKLESFAKRMGDVSHVSHGKFDGKIVGIKKEI